VKRRTAKNPAPAIREPDGIVLDLPFVQLREMDQPAKPARTFLGPLLALAILVAVFGTIAALALGDV